MQAWHTLARKNPAWRRCITSGGHCNDNDPVGNGRVPPPPPVSWRAFAFQKSFPCVHVSFNATAVLVLQAVSPEALGHPKHRKVRATCPHDCPVLIILSFLVTPLTRKPSYTTLQVLESLNFVDINTEVKQSKRRVCASMA